MDAAETTRAYYDELGAAEWDRLTRTPADEVGLEVHRRFLARHIEPGWRVLEIGAGPGRFTLQLAELGAHVVVTDLSPVQLDLNARTVDASEWASAVESRFVLDVRDTGRFDDREFDAVVAYGGPLSYVFDDVEHAVSGLLRITRGPVVASVMSLLGTWRSGFPSVCAMEEAAGIEANDAVLRTGDLRHIPGHEHACRLLRWSDVTRIVAHAGGSVVDGSASNWAALSDPEAVARLRADPVRWAHFLDHEVCACAEPGARDGGTHILFAATAQQR